MFGGCGVGGRDDDVVFLAFGVFLFFALWLWQDGCPDLLVCGSDPDLDFGVVLH